MNRLHLLLALILCPLLGCPAERPDDDDVADDDDSAVDDDDSAVDDDDSTESACTQPAGPYTLNITGGQNETLDFDLVCNPLGGDSWTLRYEGPGGWIMLVSTGPLLEGEDTATGNSVNLRDTTQQGVSFTSAQTGAAVVVSTEIYDGTAPCGSFTTEAIGAADGSTVELAPQPIPFACP